MVHFLKILNQKRTNILGIEPSSNVANIAKKNGIKTLNKFFNLNTLKKLKVLKKILI